MFSIFLNRKYILNTFKLDYAVKMQNKLRSGWNLSFKESCKAWKRLSGRIAFL